MSSWLTLHSPSRPVHTRQVTRWWVHWTRHLSFGGSLRTGILKRARFEIATPPESSDGLSSTFAQPLPDRSDEKLCRAWQCPVFSSNWKQLAMKHYESLWRVDPDGESWVYQGQRFQDEHRITRSGANASALVFFIGQCVDLSLSNSLSILQERLFINWIIIYLQKRCLSIVMDPNFIWCLHESNFNNRDENLLK